MTSARCVGGLVVVRHAEPGATVQVIADVNGRVRRMGFFGTGDVRETCGEELQRAVDALCAWARSGMHEGVTGPGGDA